MSYAQTLILTPQYYPHKVVTYRDALTMMFNGKLEIIAQYDEILAHLDKQSMEEFPQLKKSLRQVVGTDVTSFTLKVPAVAVLFRQVRLVKSSVRFSKINVCLRDKFRCQYCGERFRMSLLNMDHVYPKSYGGQKTWENIVMSCYPCNGRKADRTPQEAGMQLLSVPVKPKTLPMSGPILDADEVPEEWQPFLVAS